MKRRASGLCQFYLGLYGPGERTPGKAPAGGHRKYGTEAPLEMEYASRKIRLPEELEEGTAFPVRKYHIDTNEHVNNCQYVQMALETLGEELLVRKVSRVQKIRCAGRHDLSQDGKRRRKDSCGAVQCGGKTVRSYGTDRRKEMLEEGLGKKQTLAVVKKTEFGVYLGTEEERVLLPRKQVPEARRWEMR